MTLADVPVGKDTVTRYMGGLRGRWTLRRKRKISYCNRDSKSGSAYLSTKLWRRNCEVMVRKFLGWVRDTALREISDLPLDRNLEGHNSWSWTVAEARNLLPLTGSKPHSSDRTAARNTLHSSLRTSAA